MPLSWNEIKHRAIAFARDWKGVASEKSERQTFWNEFFEVFGKKRRTLAAFEEPVKKLSGNWGFIDLFWPGTCLVEHKSAGEDLGKAHAQGMDYVRGLIDSKRDKEVPRWLIVSDFNRIAIHDLEPEQDPEMPLFNRLPPSVEFPLKELHKNVRHFAFIAGYRHHKLNPEDPANFDATELMAKLHDALYDGGYHGHRLCQFLVRLLFCFFADDTGIFPSDQFKLFLNERTTEDGSDLGAKLAHLFQILNTPEDKRGKNLDEDLAQFPYVNGDLFAEALTFADFTTTMRAVLLECAEFKWEKISPAVFGSLFQTVFDHEDDRKRRQLGAHYTSEQNIMKVVRSLFLDELRAEFDAAKKDKSGRGRGRLEALQKRLASLKIMDPACGCGNFLVVTYRELRQLELEILLVLHQNALAETQHEFALDVTQLSKLNVDQMFGIEIEEFPARIAEVALWLADHQANILLSEAFGQLYRRIPLRKSPHIVVGNALQIDWKTVLPAEQCSYVLGNPPFVGKTFMSAEQKADMNAVCGKVKGAGVLDFVTGWYFKAAEYIRQTACPSSSAIAMEKGSAGFQPASSSILPEIISVPGKDAGNGRQDACPPRVAFVSTNSISQGEQPGVLWGELYRRGMKIHFAHRTFPWESEARGKAHVHVVILGFGPGDVADKFIIDYDTDVKNPVRTQVSNINPYLTEGNDSVVRPRSAPISQVEEMTNGSKPVEGGHLLLTRDDYDALLIIEPDAKRFIRRFVGAEEFINGSQRWCLWLKDALPHELRSMPAVMERIERVKASRLASKDATTRANAARPALFAYDRQPLTRYLAVPEVSSERRPYVPMAFLPLNMICSNKIQYVPDATLYHFGVLTSQMHMAWMRAVCGRLKSDYSYSKDIVYNNFPWPEPTDAQRTAVEKAAQRVLDAREQFPTSTLADLYDPTTMPPALAKAHAELDRTVDRCYRKDAFPNDRTRVEHLFALYEKLTAPLVAPAKKKRWDRRDFH